MAPKVCLTGTGTERSDDNSLNKLNMYELTISYCPTYHDKEKQYRVTDAERKHYIDDVINKLKKSGIECEKVTYETMGTTGNKVNLHVHCIALSKVRIYPYPRYSKFSLRFTQKWKKLGITGWLDYLRKQTKKEHYNTEKWFLKPENFVFSNL